MEGNKMVRFHQVNDWMKLIGNLGVFLGLLLVALQMQQSNNIARAEQEAEASKAYQDLEIAMLGEHGAAAWTKSLMDPASMTLEEIKIVDSYLVNALNFLRRTQTREKAGLEPEGAFEAEIKSSSAFFFGSAFARIWYQNEKEHHADNPDLIRFMDQALASHEKDHTAKWMLRIQRDIRQLPPVTMEDLN
jgi:hypothetical protein